MASVRDQLVNKIAEAHKRQSEIMVELQRSLLLSDFFPAAFEHGACTSFVRGNPWKPYSMWFVVRTGDGEEHEWLVLDVPAALWERYKEEFRKTTRGSVKEWRA